MHRSRQHASRYAVTPRSRRASISPTFPNWWTLSSSLGGCSRHTRQERSQRPAMSIQSDRRRRDGPRRLLPSGRRQAVAVTSASRPSRQPQSGVRTWTGASQMTLSFSARSLGHWRSFDRVCEQKLAPVSRHRASVAATAHASADRRHRGE